MPKKKKTRKQKEMADVRKLTGQTVSPHTPTISLRQSVKEEPSTVPSPAPSVSKKAYRVSTGDYQYLGKDLRKTLLLTVVIIGLELALKFGTGI